MNKNKKSKKSIGKVNRFLYSVLYFFIKHSFTKKYGITFDKDIVKDIKGPAIVLATHMSDEDHILSALTLYPIRPTYIVSEHFMHNRTTSKLLKLMHVITKKMFTPDVSTIINVMRAKHENAVIVIFPEGRLSCYGHTLPVAEGTAELIKKLGVDLYVWKVSGAYLSFPKWREHGDDRRGKIHASVELLLSADEVAAREVSEIKSIADAAILHDDELAMAGVEYKCRDTTKGIDKILFKCPRCLKEGTITAGDCHIRCECGLDATLDNFYRLHDAPFERVNEWFEWQQSTMDTENGHLESAVRLGACREDGFMDENAGEGVAYIDKNIFKLSGTVHGEKIEISMPPEKVGAFPITPGKHIDIYNGGDLIYIYTEPDERECVKWVCFLDNLMAKKREGCTAQLEA